MPWSFSPLTVRSKEVLNTVQKFVEIFRIRQCGKIQVRVFSKERLEALEIQLGAFSGDRIPQTPLHDIDLKMEKVEIKKFTLGPICEPVKS